MSRSSPIQRNIFKISLPPAWHLAARNCFAVGPRADRGENIASHFFRWDFVKGPGKLKFLILPGALGEDNLAPVASKRYLGKWRHCSDHSH